MQPSLRNWHYRSVCVSGIAAGANIQSGGRV